MNRNIPIRFLTCCGCTLIEVEVKRCNQVCRVGLPTWVCSARRSAGFTGHVIEVDCCERVLSQPHLDAFLVASHTLHPHHLQQPAAHPFSTSLRSTTTMAEDDSSAKKPKRTYRACLPCRSVSFGTPSPDSPARLLTPTRPNCDTLRAARCSPCHPA